ncbi:uncharacterized protein LOC134463344 isoform X1 [Engraulis encrasicolus]|uniref:uncharacterized protein LOC134444324 isoform X1 n=1 Tax=Engraulis encrasicolus TaxID=184585 RepID=UPI002FCEE2CA
MANSTCACSDLANANERLAKANMTIETLRRDIRRLQCEVVIKSHNTTLKHQTSNTSANLTTLSFFPSHSKHQPKSPPNPPCSTPARRSWTEVVNGGRGVLQKCSPPLVTSNRFSVLDSVIDAETDPVPPSHQVPKPLPQRVRPRSRRTLATPRQITREQPAHSEPRRPSTVLIGSSMVRHVTLRNAQTWCLPGALVADVQSNVPDALSQYPTATTLIVHAGSNDIRLQQSKKLESDFLSLINTLSSTGKKYAISGPIPSVCFSAFQFSRIRQLHVWLMRHCRQEAIPYVDNFSAFWNRRNLFARDGRHLNRSGARLLATNLELTLEAHRSLD